MTIGTLPNFNFTRLVLRRVKLTSDPHVKKCRHFFSTLTGSQIKIIFKKLIHLYCFFMQSAYACRTEMILKGIILIGIDKVVRKFQLQLRVAIKGVSKTTTNQSKSKKDLIRKVWKIQSTFKASDITRKFFPLRIMPVNVF